MVNNRTTSAAILGTFSNLSDGATVTIDGTIKPTTKSGNDLTLTVVLYHTAFSLAPRASPTGVRNFVAKTAEGDS